VAAFQSGLHSESVRAITSGDAQNLRRQGKYTALSQANATLFAFEVVGIYDTLAQRSASQGSTSVFADLN
jgi:hypothetical protein